ncbi:MAG: glycoside hydrolase family 18 protein [Peptococcaceae bacterium]|nr:glycoside hydrolase family 18 protein [Peptococcaceae bacterium]
MQIYVVKPGDNLSAIAQRFGITPNELVKVNRIPNPNNLVEGQTIVIPSVHAPYTIKPGDTMWLLAKRNKLKPQDLLDANPGVNPNKLRVGQSINLTVSRPPARTIEVNAYIDPLAVGGHTLPPIQAAGANLTYLSLFSYRVTPAGEIIGPDDSEIVSTARSFGEAPVLVVTNFDGTNFSPQLAHAVMSEAQVKERLIQNILNHLRARNYQGVNVDFERVRPEDRELLNGFMADVAARMRQAGYPFSTALAPKTSDWQTGEWYGAHDYRAHGQIADYVIIMTYEWGWSGGPPYAVAPIVNVRQVLDYAVTVIPRKKIMMGVPLYGYDWTLPYVAGGPWARTISPQQAIEIAAAHGVAIRYDTKLQSPWFNYRDSNGREHTVWFEDARSINAKFNLVNEYGLRGVSYWALGHDFPQNWLVLAGRFKIKKY